ncbi:hypothetical protein LNAOJCKE_4845 [Methylorubrum aminovorans]|jgi:hypothetical protein|uniref:Uncharacterized protein n=2 Tax=Methylorubrum TaxID=2282523 RepID=A0AA40VDL1_9HYPH|nr:MULTISPECIES: hypothetical protein [Methylorubrum]MBA8916062.1 hypothetical protein [Methylorubrum thiocyanatum]UGB28594.1 hypothetical protein LPC10_25135 [Methylorubrum sp. B1-46]GJE67613.1 hypothetical protein LNAOJCKE_4845 [Methylorubrum aminovorans]GJE82226.1 hypothetical protein CJNNKLLH_3589 [Methylorubrum thiocyanatum]
MNGITMRVASLGLALMSATSATAEAPAAQPDNAAIMRALEALNRRLDQLESKERKSPNTSVAALPAAKPAAPKGKAVPGWFVRLIPWSQDGNSEAVAGFPGPMFDFNFDMHSRYITGQNRFIYNGVSILNAKEDGIYVFSMVLDPVLTIDPLFLYGALWFNCSGSFYVGGNRLITGTTAFGSDRRPERDVYRSQSYFGSVRLTPGTHRVEFKVDCGMTQEKNLAVFDQWLPYWKKNRFKVMLKTPSDTAPRPFLPEELYYVGLPQ